MLQRLQMVYSVVPGDTQTISSLPVKMLRATQCQIIVNVHYCFSLQIKKLNYSG